MNEETRKSLLEAGGAKASDMTHWLREYGEGSMSTGLSNFWASAHEEGMRDGAELTCIVIGAALTLFEAGRYFYRKAKRKETARALEAAYAAGAAAGRKEVHSESCEEDEIEEYEG